MRFLPMALGAVLWAGVLLLAGVAEARADAPAGPDASSAVADAGGPLPAQPGTDAEARDYAQREADSPEAQEFVGGLLGLLVFIVLVLLIVWLAKEI